MLLRRLRRRGASVVLSAAAAGYLGVAVWLTVNAVHRPLSDRQADLHVYLGAIHAVAGGSPLYSYVAGNGDPFTYPPFALLVLWPAGWLPEPVMRIVWTAVTCVVPIVLASIVWRRRAGASAARHLTVLAAAFVLLVSAPLQSNLRFGQVSVLLAALALADAAEVTPPRWRGVLIGLTAAVKLTPLLFIVHLVVVGQRRAAARAVLVFAGCTALAAAVLPGDSFTFWTRAIFTTSRIGDLTATGNQSLNGMLLRAPVTATSREAAVLLLSVVACAAALYRSRALCRSGHRVEAAIITGCATLAVSPVSWTHHQVWTVLAALALIARGTWIRRAAAAVIIIVMTVRLPASSVGPAAVAGWLTDNARGLSVFALCCLGLITAWRAARTPGEISIGRISVRPRALAVTGGVAILLAGGLLVTHLVRVQMLTRQNLAASLWRTALNITDDNYDKPEAWPPVYPGMPLNYGGPAGDGTVGGGVSPAVARLVLVVSGGPGYDVPLLAGRDPGVRVWAFSISDPRGADLLAYDAHGALICRCGQKLRDP